MKKINIGLIGIGNIGSGVVKVFRKKSALLERKLGIRLAIKTICDVNPNARKRLPRQEIYFKGVI